MIQLSLDLEVPEYLPLSAYDRPGDDLDAPLSPSEMAALAYHGYTVRERDDGDYDVTGGMDGWPVMRAWQLRQDIDLFYLCAKAAQARHPLENL